MRTLQGLPLTMLIWGLINTQLGKVPWGHCKDYLWQCWSGGVCQSTHNLEGIHEDIARITSDNVDPGGSIDTQLEKDPQGHCKDYLRQCWPWRGQSTCNLERIHEDIARITSDNVDPGGSIDTQLGKDQQGHCKDYLWQCWSWGVDWHTTWKGTMRTLQGLPLTMLILGGWLTHNLERIHEDNARITSDTVDPGGWLTHNLERIQKDIARITSDNVDSWGVDWHTTWKGSVKTSQGLPLTMLILGGQSIHNLERIHEDIARITSYNVDPGVWLTHNLERIHEDITRITSDNVDPGGVNWHKTWKGSIRTLQGLPLTMLILVAWLTHNLERIHEDITRITSDNVDPGGFDQDTTWKGSMRTLQGLPLAMLILGGWLTHNLERNHEDIARITSDNVDPGGQLTHNCERIHEDIARITSDNVDPGGSIDTQLGKDPSGHCKDYLWQCWLGGWLTHNLERICEDIAWITSDNVDPGGSINTQLGKDPWGHCKDYLWQCWSWGLGQHTTWKGSMRTSQGLPLTMLILGGWSTHNLKRIHEDITRITSDNVDPGGLIDTQLGKDPQGHCKDYLWQCWSRGLIGTQLGKDPWGHCKDYLWQCWSWGVNWHTTRKESVWTLQGLPLTMFILGAWLTHNLERIGKNIARITSDNVDPGGLIDTQLGKDPWGHHKDYLWQCWSWGVDWHTTWKGSMKTSQGLPLTMLILGVNKHTTWKGSMRTLQGLPVTMLILGFDWNTT